MKKVNELDNRANLYEDIKYVQLSKTLRLVILLWFTSVLLIVGGFLWYISLPVEEEIITVDSQDNGIANYIGNDGVINNGEN